MSLCTICGHPESNEECCRNQPCQGCVNLEAERDVLVKTIEDRGHAFQDVSQKSLEENRKLKARVERLTAALEKIMNYSETFVTSPEGHMRVIAKQALAEQEGK